MYPPWSKTQSMSLAISNSRAASACEVSDAGSGLARFGDSLEVGDAGSGLAPFGDSCDVSDAGSGFAPFGDPGAGLVPFGGDCWGVEGKVWAGGTMRLRHPVTRRQCLEDASAVG